VYCLALSPPTKPMRICPTASVAPGLTISRTSNLECGIAGRRSRNWRKQELGFRHRRQNEIEARVRITARTPMKADTHALKESDPLLPRCKPHDGQTGGEPQNSPPGKILDPTLPYRSLPTLIFKLDEFHRRGAEALSSDKKSTDKVQKPTLGSPSFNVWLHRPRLL